MAGTVHQSVRCAQRLQLIRDYDHAVRFYSEIVARYADLAATGYNADRTMARMAWDAADRARVATA